MASWEFDLYKCHVYFFQHDARSQTAALGMLRSLMEMHKRGEMPNIGFSSVWNPLRPSRSMASGGVVFVTTLCLPLPVAGYLMF
jgi:hypothetical protein